MFKAACVGEREGDLRADFISIVAPRRTEISKQGRQEWEYQGARDWRFDLNDCRDSYRTCSEVASVLLTGGFCDELPKWIAQRGEW